MKQRAEARRSWRARGRLQEQTMHNPSPAASVGHSSPSRAMRIAAFAASLLFTVMPGAIAAQARIFGAAGANAKQKPAYPSSVTMASAKLAHWAPVVSDVYAHRAPNRLAPVVAQITTLTGDETQNIVLILKQLNLTPTQTGYDARLAILPNDSTGWVPRSALGNVYAVTTHLYINQKTFTATLKRGGVTIFTTRVGVGEPYWPTPAGQFYIRDRLTDFKNPAYGPLAFGTSGRSPVLTEWPGGGFVGVHGTDLPSIIPGRISHGCIRMTNPSILALGKLISVGTPVTVSAA
jgi:lipoprotein-anchoring transpeptidase ErfK/SrfK